MEKQFLKERILAASGHSEEHIEKVFNAFLQRVSEVLKQNQTIRIENIGLFQLQVEPVSRLDRDASKKSKEILIYRNIKSQSEGQNLFLTIDLIPESPQSSAFNESVFNLSIDEPSTIFDAPETSEGDNELEGSIQQSVNQIISAGVILDGYQLFNTENTEEKINESLEDHELTIESFEDNSKRELEDLISEPEEVIEEEVVISEEQAENSQIHEIEDNEEDIKVDDETEVEDVKKSPFDELAELINQDKDFVKENVQANEEKINDIEAIEENGNKRVVMLAVAAFFLIIVIATVIFTSQSDDSTSEMKLNIEEPQTKPATINEESIALIDSSKTDTLVKPETTAEVVLLKEETKKDVEKVLSANARKSTYTGLYRDIPNDISITDRVYFDGNKYTVQISSWKSKSFAEHEVAKYRKMGHDAFVFSIYIKLKESVWNRVRIGYFDSQQEAEAFLKKNKL